MDVVGTYFLVAGAAVLALGFVSALAVGSWTEFENWKETNAGSSLFASVLIGVSALASSLLIIGLFLKGLVGELS